MFTLNTIDEASNYYKAIGDKELTFSKDLRFLGEETLQIKQVVVN